MKFVVENKKGFISFVTSTVFAASLGVSSLVVAGEDDLTVQDQMVTTIIDKSVIAGEIRKDASGNMIVDEKGMLSFDYTGDVFSIETNRETGELKEMGDKIGTIKGTAAFPTGFAELSMGMKVVMDLIESGYTFKQALGMLPGFKGMPPVIPWTCNSCEMVIGDTTYVSLVNALDPVNGDPMMIGLFDAMIDGGAAATLEATRLDGRAFTSLTPASFDPFNKTMSVRMAGCSAIVGVEGPNAGKMGTLCLNSTATFNISQIDYSGNIFENGSGISAEGTSNCVTVLHTPMIPE